MDVAILFMVINIIARMTKINSYLRSRSKNITLKSNKDDNIHK